MRAQLPKSTCSLVDHSYGVSAGHVTAVSSSSRQLLICISSCRSLNVRACGCATDQVFASFTLPQRTSSVHTSSTALESVKVNMAGDIPKEVVVLIVIVSAGGCVVIAWAIHSIWHGKRGSDEEILVGNSEQDQAAYRQEVRMRNYENMAAMNGLKKPSHRYDEI